MHHLDSVFAELRSILQTSELTSAQCHKVYGLATQAHGISPDLYHAQWLPYLQSFSRHWLAHPLKTYRIEHLARALRALPFVPCYAEFLDKDIMGSDQYDLPHTWTHHVISLRLTQSCIKPGQLIQEHAHLHFPNLQSLDAPGMQLRSPQTSALINWLGAPQLESLNLEGNQLDDANMQDIVDSGAHKNLRSLCLNGNAAISDHGLKNLLSVHWPELERLYLGGTEIGDQGALELGRSHNFPNLKSMRLNRTRIGWAGISAFINEPRWHILEDINLPTSELSPIQIEQLTDCPHLAGKITSLR